MFDKGYGEGPEGQPERGSAERVAEAAPRRSVTKSLGRTAVPVRSRVSATRGQGMRHVARSLSHQQAMFESVRPSVPPTSVPFGSLRMI